MRKNSLRILYAVFLFIFSALIIFSCKKSETTGEEKQNNEMASKKKPTTPKKKNPSAKYPGPCPYPCGDSRCDAYSEPNPDCPPAPTGEYSDVTEDQNFVTMTQIDQQLNSLTDTSMRDWTEEEFTVLQNKISAATTNEQLATAFTEAGYTNSTQIVSLLQQKVNATMQLVQNNNRFTGKSPDEIKSILTSSYLEYQGDT